MKLIQPLQFLYKSPPAIVDRPRRAVVMLGGGGARGIAHLGSLEALADCHLAIDRVVGVSMGSLVGAMFAANPSMPQIQRHAIEYLESPEFAAQYETLLSAAPHLKAGRRRTQQSDWYGWIQKLIMTSQQIRKLFQGKSFIGNEFLVAAVEELVPDIDVRETKIPLTILAAELSSGLPVAIESGSLRQAVIASSSIPGFFPPVPWEDDMLLCDLGTVNSMPCEIARAYASDLTIGIDVAGAIEPVDEFSHAIDIMIRMDEIGERMSRRKSYRQCDLVIQPKVQHRAWFDFRRPDELIRAGCVAAKQQLSQVEWGNKRLSRSSLSIG